MNEILIGKYDVGLSVEQERLVIEFARAGMDTLELCYMLGFQPNRMLRHARANKDFHDALRQAEEEGKKISKLDVYITLVENGYKTRLAYRLSGLNAEQVGQIRRENDRFDIRCREAEAFAKEALESSVYKRAIEGDNILSMFLLKAMDPTKYRETQRHVDEKPEADRTVDEKFAIATAIAFALRDAAEGAAAAAKAEGGSDRGEQAMDPPGRPAD